MRQLPPKREPTPGVSQPKAPGIGDLLKIITSQTLQSRPEAAKWMGEALLHAVDPARWEYYQDVARYGGKVSPSTMISAYRSTMNPNWEGPSPNERTLAEAAQWMKYPGSAAGGIAGAAVTKGSPAGALAGKSLGWMVPDLISMYLNPELANRSALTDVVEYAGGKVLGTIAGRGYRALVQPQLASRGLLSAAKHPVLSKVIPLAEQVLLEPATGPGAPKHAVGVPKRMGRWLRTKGPQGVEPEAAMLANMKRSPWVGEIQGELGVPQVARQLGIPGTEVRALASARMRGRGLPQYPGGAVSVSPAGAQGSLTFPSFQLPLPGGSSVTVTPAMRGAATRTPPAGLGVPSLAPRKAGLVVEAMRSLPPVPERTPLVGEVPWGERTASPFNFPEGYVMGKQPPLRSTWNQAVVTHEGTGAQGLYEYNPWRGKLTFTGRGRNVLAGAPQGRGRLPKGTRLEAGPPVPGFLRGWRGTAAGSAAGLGYAAATIGPAEVSRRKDKTVWTRVVRRQEAEARAMEQEIREKQIQVRRVRGER